MPFRIRIQSAHIHQQTHKNIFNTTSKSMIVQCIIHLLYVRMEGANQKLQLVYIRAPYCELNAAATFEFKSNITALENNI